MTPTQREGHDFLFFHYGPGKAGKIAMNGTTCLSLCDPDDDQRNKVELCADLRECALIIQYQEAIRKGQRAMQTLNQISTFLSASMTNGNDRQMVETVLSTDFPKTINDLSDAVLSLENCWKSYAYNIEQKSRLNDQIANYQQDRLISLLEIASEHKSEHKFEDVFAHMTKNIDFTNDAVRNQFYILKKTFKEKRYTNIKLVTALEKCNGDLQTLASQVRMMVCGEKGSIQYLIIRHRAITEVMHEKAFHSNLNNEERIMRMARKDQEHQRKLEYQKQILARNMKINKIQ